MAKRVSKAVLKSLATSSMLCFATATLFAHSYSNLTLPQPHKTHTKGTVLTMHAAVMMTLRNSPDVLSSELARVTDKYNVLLAKYNYMPHLTLGGTIGLNSGSHLTTTVNPSISVDQSPIGVTGGVSYDPSTGQVSLSVKKSLWAGNSHVADMNAWWSAEEQAKLDQMNYRLAIVNAIHKTTSAYRGVVTAKLTLSNSEANLNNDLEQLKDAKLKLKLGRGTTYDVNQSKLDVATDKSDIIANQQALQTARVTLNEALGLSAEAKMHVKDEIPLPQIHLGTLSHAIQAALKVSADYQEAKINLCKAQRQLIINKNAAKPELDYEGQLSLGGSQTPNNLTNTISWGIPIFNLPNKVNIITARIDVINAQEAVKTSYNAVISQVTLDYDNLKNEMTSWQLAKESLALNEETVKQQTAQYQAGQLNLYDLSSAKQALTTKRNDLQSTKDSLWSYLEAYRTDIGTVLSSWHITLKPVQYFNNINQ